MLSLRTMGKRKSVERLEADLVLAKARKGYNEAKAAHRKVLEKFNR